MLLAELPGHPHDRGRLGAARVGQDLTQVEVVRPPVLILDDHGRSGCHLTSDDVERELPDLVVPGLQLDVQPEDVAEQVCVVQQPGVK